MVRPPLVKEKSVEVYEKAISWRKRSNEDADRVLSEGFAWWRVSSCVERWKGIAGWRRETAALGSDDQGSPEERPQPEKVN